MSSSIMFGVGASGRYIDCPLRVRARTHRWLCWRKLDEVTEPTEQTVMVNEYDYDGPHD